MSLRRWLDRAHSVPGAPAVRGIGVTDREWTEIARDVAAAGGRLLALWGSNTDAAGAAVYAAFLLDEGVLIAELPINTGEQTAHYAGLEALFPAASRMQRALFDLCGLRCSDPDRRGWLRHDAEYEFLRISGDGVHEIPVGPVHAGIIEPGHFRFSVVGEKVLKLEQRLGYTHKDIERRFTQLPILQGHRLAARVSGDSAVAFSWSYCQALEGMSECAVPPRAAWLRAALLELERIANHLGDLGALGNDAGFAFGLAQFSRLKEQLLRATEQAFGERYLMNAVVPGGTRADIAPAAAVTLSGCIGAVAREARVLHGIYEEHAGLRDRFMDAGRLATDLARQLGVLGLAGRASGQSLDLRIDFPCLPYGDLAPAKIVREAGDVAARVAVRFDELQESCRLVGRILDALPPGPHLATIEAPAADSFGAGLIEGWRGPVFVALESGPDGSIRRCHPHDPSWQNWPALEHAIIGNIVPDFPLINKSFNLSYSGHDL